MNARRTIAAAAVLVAVWLNLGCGEAGDKGGKLPEDVVKVLEAAEVIEIESIDPSVDKGAGGWKSLGKTLVKDADTRKQVREALYKSAAEGKGLAKCFEPRHIVRASANGKSVELVICFQCDRIHITRGKDNHDIVAISAAAEPVLNKILKDAGVPLAK
jgi:hypothetical protein